MGKVTLVSSTMPVLLPMQGRSPGVHATDILRDLCVRLGKWAPFTEFNQSQLELGNAFERAILSRMQEEWPGRYVHLGELSMDDIHGTPDQGDVDEEAVDEVKCTWMSSAHQPGSEKFWYYENQIKTYCCMTGWRRAYLNILFVNGDYVWRKKDTKLTIAEAGPSHFRRYQYDFGQAELDQHWSVMCRHAESIRARQAVAGHR